MYFWEVYNKNFPSDRLEAVDNVTSLTAWAKTTTVPGSNKPGVAIFPGGADPGTTGTATVAGKTVNWQLTGPGLIGYTVSGQDQDEEDRQRRRDIIRRILETPNSNTYRLPNVSPRLIDPYACIRCHPWDGRYDSPHPPQLTAAQKRDLVWTAGVVLLIATAPLSLPAAGGIAGTIGPSAAPLSSAAAVLLITSAENAKKK
jgi:hypothetical protein